jgi:hypothetical protein
VSRTFLDAVGKSQAAPITLVPSVPKRPHPTAPDFGAWLLELRADRSAEAVARQIRPLVAKAGLKVDQSLIHKIEGGRIPNWPLLAAFSRVYRVPLLEVVQRLTDSVQFPGASDLFRHGTELEDRGTPSAPASVVSKERPHVRSSPAAPGALDAAVVLEELLEAAVAFRALSVQADDWATRLTTFAADLGYNLPRRKDSMVRVPPSTRAQGVRGDDRPHAGQSRRKRS